MEKYIYKISDKTGKYYFGSTICPRHRLAEHKYEKKDIFDTDSLKMEVLFLTKDFERIEESILKKHIGNPLCLNKTYGCFGPKGLVFSKKIIFEKKIKMKMMWKNEFYIKKFKEGKRKSEASMSYSERSKKSLQKRLEKMPVFYVKHIESGKIYGPYQGYKKASLDLGLHVDTIYNCLKKSKNSKKFEIYYAGGVK